MKYLKLYESFDEYKIQEICIKYDIFDYKINNDGSIDVDSYVNLYSRRLTSLPLKFNKVNFFDCSSNKLTSLEGSPKEVNGVFYCNCNKLKSFKYAPNTIRGAFDCRGNHIKTFEYFPSFVKDGFLCENNPIFEVWKLFRDIKKIELLNYIDIFRDEDTDTPAIILNGLNDFLITTGSTEYSISSGIIKKQFSYNRATEEFKSYKII